MRTKAFELFKIFGFPIRVDASWLIILFLVTYSLAAGYFPYHHQGLPKTAYWAMGFVSAMGLFISILLHELSHALVARHYQIPIDGITLFIFGGVAEMRDEAPSPKSEFLMALVGPVASAALAFLFFHLYQWAHAQELNKSLVLIFYYLGMMNLLVAIFNMVPAFPLDGGRIFRSLLWWLKKDYIFATRVAAKLGKGFGWLLIGLGGLQVVQGNLFGGFWYVLIGFFLKRASSLSVEQVEIKRTLGQTKVGDLMDTRVEPLHPQDPLWTLSTRFTHQQPYSHYPVTEQGRLVGFLDLTKFSPEGEQREGALVGDLMERDFRPLSVGPNCSAWQAFVQMRQEKAGNLLVEVHGVLQGILDARNLLTYMQQKVKIP